MDMPGQAIQHRLMRHTLTAATLLAWLVAAGCGVESMNGPARPTTALVRPDTCATTRPTGSNIARVECHPQPSRDDVVGREWRNDPFRPDPFRQPSQATDTPGLRVYQ